MPKSRGRRKGAKSRPVRRSPRPLHPADLLLREARDIIELDDVLSRRGVGQRLARPGLVDRGVDRS